MTDLFVSYSRRDKDFVQQLVQALADQGRDVWVDWEDIPLTADWLQEIYDGIDEADAFVFVLTPNSAQSEVCGWEVKHAVESGKRLIPIVHHEITDESDREKVHPAINAHNWLFFREEDDFDATFKLLTDALDTDLDHVRDHTKLLVRAKEWDTRDRSKGFLITGDELAEAESWLSHAAAKQPEPVELHYEYIYASRQAATRRQQQLIVMSVAVAVVSLVLAIAAVIGFTDANRQRNIAERNAEVSERLALAANAQTEFIADNNDTAIALALEAVDINEPPVEAQRILETTAYAPGVRSVIEAHDGGAFSVDINAGGTRIVTGSEDMTVAVWDMDGTLIHRMEAHENDLLDTIFTPDGTQIISGDRDGVVYRWNADDGEIVWRYDQTGNTVRAMAVSPDGEILVVGTHDGQLIFLNAVDGSEVERISEAHTARIRDAEFSADGTQLATTSDDDTLAIWDPVERSELQRFTAENQLTGVAFSPDGTEVLTGAGDFNVYVWNLESGQRTAALGGHVAWINDVVVAPGGVFALSSSNDNTLRLWNLHTNRNVLRLTGHTRGVWDVAFTHDGQAAVSVSWDGTLRIWDISHGFEQSRYEGHNNAVGATGFSPDGTRAFTASWDGSLMLWDTSRGTQINTWTDGTLITHAEYSPDGRTILAADVVGTLLLFDGETGDVLHTIPEAHDTWIPKTAFSPDSTLVLSAGADATVALWDVETRELVHRFTDLGVNATRADSVAFNSDGTRAVSVIDNARIIIWDVTTLEEINHIDVDGKKPSSALFVPGDDSHLIVTIDTQIVLMDAETGEVTRRFIGHTSTVEGRIVAGSDGQTLVSAAADGTIRVWNLETGQEVHRLDTGIQVLSLSINADMTMALIGNNDETARLINIIPPALDETVHWAQANRYVPEFTCQERLQYRLNLDEACQVELGINTASADEGGET